MKFFLLSLSIFLTGLTFSGLAQDSSKSDCSQLEWDGREELEELYIVERYPRQTTIEKYKIEKYIEHNEPTVGAYTHPDTTRLPGETSQFRHYLLEQISYPKIAIEMGIQGKTFFTFEVDSEGYTRNFQIKRGVDKHVDREIHSAIMKTPKMVYKEGQTGDNGLPPGCYRMAVFFRLK